MHCSVEVPADVMPLSSGQAANQAAARGTAMRVGDTWRGWLPDGCFVFRESCEHEVTINPQLPSPRVVLIADFANPLLASAALYREALLPGVARSAEATAEYRAFGEHEAREALNGSGNGSHRGGGHRREL